MGEARSDFGRREKGMRVKRETETRGRRKGKEKKE